MCRLPAILGLLAVLAAAGCRGNTPPTVHGSALSGGPAGLRSKPPPPPALPTVRR